MAKRTIWNFLRQTVEGMILTFAFQSFAAECIIKA